MKKRRFIKKLLSVIISIFILNSFVMNDVIYAAFQIQPIGIISQPAKIFNPDVATITDYFISPYSDKGLLVFIQDLHTNPTVQKNISKTLELLDKQYGIDRIYLEGLPSGKANIESLMALKEYDIDDDLLNKNMEGIVEQDDIQAFVIADQFLDAVTAALVNSYRHVREFLLHLIGLVSNIEHCCLGVCQDESLAFAFVSTTEYGYMEKFLEVLCQIFHMRGLASSANSDVAY